MHADQAHSRLVCVLTGAKFLNERVEAADDKILAQTIARLRTPRAWVAVRGARTATQPRASTRAVAHTGLVDPLDVQESVRNQRASRRSTWRETILV